MVVGAATTAAAAGVLHLGLGLTELVLLSLHTRRHILVLTWTLATHLMTYIFIAKQICDFHLHQHRYRWTYLLPSVIVAILTELYRGGTPSHWQDSRALRDVKPQTCEWARNGKEECEADFVPLKC